MKYDRALGSITIPIPSPKRAALSTKSKPNFWQNTI